MIAANTAYSQSRFHFNKEIQKYLDQLYRDAFRIQQIRSDPHFFDPFEGKDKAMKINEALTERMNILGYSDTLAEKLEEYMRLDDFSSAKKSK